MIRVFVAGLVLLLIAACSSGGVPSRTEAISDSLREGDVYFSGVLTGVPDACVERASCPMAVEVSSGSGGVQTGWEYLIVDVEKTPCLGRIDQGLWQRSGVEVFAHLNEQRELEVCGDSRYQIKQQVAIPLGGG